MARRTRRYFQRYFKTDYIPISRDFNDIADSFLSKSAQGNQDLAGSISLDHLQANKVDTSGAIANRVEVSSGFFTAQAVDVHCSAYFPEVRTGMQANAGGGSNVYTARGIFVISSAVSSAANFVNFENFSGSDEVSGRSVTVFNDVGFTIRVDSQGADIDGSASYNLPTGACADFIHLDDANILSRRRF